MEIIENGVARQVTLQEQAVISAREAMRDGELLGDVTARIKAEAMRRIFDVVPEWKQRNMTARSAELLKIRLENGSWTTGEQDEANALLAVWQTIKDIRQISDGLETSLAPMMPSQLRVFDASDDAHWTP